MPYLDAFELHGGIPSASHLLDDEHLSEIASDRNSLFLQVIHGEGKATICWHNAGPHESLSAENTEAGEQQQELSCMCFEHGICQWQ